VTGVILTGPRWLYSPTSLRAQRELARLSRNELAARLNYSASLISMIESGHRSPSRDFAARCDEAFGTPGTFARLEKRLRDVPFSSGFRPFQPYESEATSLRLFEHTLIPGLLQIEAYARGAGDPPEHQRRGGRGAGGGADGPAGDGYWVRDFGGVAGLETIDGSVSGDCEQIRSDVIDSVAAA
jgi:transcriptional regulator with XRE-family HTH domain